MLIAKKPGSEGFVGPGHNGDIVEDKSGQTWMVYHAFSKQQPTRRVMLLDKISWIDDWPVIDRAVPGLHKQAVPVFR